MPASRRKNTRGTKRGKKASTRRPSAKKEAEVVHELPGGFWRQILAVLMIAAALFFVITWFGHGGSALNQVHDNVMKALGVATYFIPAILVYLAVKKFRAENNKVAIPVYIILVIDFALILSSSSLLFS